MGSGLTKKYRKLFAYALFLGVFTGGILLLNAPVSAAPGVSQHINFQGRLLNAQGATVPDGFYNIEFKIYQDGDGQTIGNTTGAPAGSLKWTESHLNANSRGIQVKNGFMSVQLGSVTPFAGNVDWNQSTLWLSMNIANTNGSCTPFTSCTPDGEMVPMKPLSSTPFSLNSNMLGGLNSSQFIQSTTTPQTANIAVQSASTGSIGALIQGASSQTADIFQVKANGTSAPLLAVSSSGATTLQNAADSANALRVLNSGNGLVLGVDTAANLVRVVTGTVNTATLVSGTGALQVGADNTDNLAIDDNEIVARSNGGTGTLYLQKLGGGLIIQSDTTLIKSTTNSATAFQIQTSGSANLLTANSANNAVIIGNVASGGNAASAALYFGDTCSNFTQTCLRINEFGGTDSDILGFHGAAGFRWQTGYGTVVDALSLTTSGGTRFGIGLASPGAVLHASGLASGIDLFRVTDATTASMDVFKIADEGAVTIKTRTNSTTAFQIQPSGSTTPILNVDTSNLRVGIGTAAPAYLLDAAGDINTSTQYRIGGNVALTNSGLTFNAAATGTVQAATGQALSLSGPTGVNIQTGGISRASFDNAGGLYLGNGVTSSAPSNFSVNGTGSTTTGVTGGALTIQGGNATVGNANGGNLTLRGGSGIGTGASGLVVLSTPTFSTTTNDPNCYTGGALVATSCTIATASVNNSASVIAGFSQIGQSVTLPDPTIATAGRVVYVTAANASNEFTLLVNGGGIGNSIAMRQNTTATMIWNGNDWTAAGASSSTTLQSAYDNTLQSAGGAELIVSRTGNTNGLTIRDSTANPVNGTLLTVQTSSAAGLLSVNSNVTEYSTNGGAETSGSSSATFPANTWSPVGSAAVSRFTTAGNFIATGQGSVAVATTTAANDGVKNTLSSALIANTNYNVSFAARLASGTFTDMNVHYSVNGTAASVPCTTSQAIATSVWTKVNCTFAAPSSGIAANNAILIRQTGGGTARTMYVENLSVTIAADYNYATDGSVTDSTNFATNWSSVSGATVTHSTSVGNDASDSAQVVTTGTGQGVRNRLSINPLQSTLYRITTYAASTTAGFNNFNIRYSRDGGTSFVNCADYNTQSVSSSINSFTKITCYITTDGTAATNPYVYFTQTDATGRTFNVDTFSMTLSSNTTPNVQIGGGVNGGPVTLLTLDRGASAPIASNNDALLGSMYYDTTLGKLQCYEADGWGACGSSPDNVVTISPEYTNAVMHGTGIGTMVSDICSDTLNINDGSSSQPTICGTNETFNFYKWTSPQASAQTYGIFVTYQLPSTFKSFASGQTSIMGRTDGTNATVEYQIYRNDAATGLNPCGGVVPVSTGAAPAWQTGVASGAADPSTCGFAPGNSIVFKINVTASQNANTYVGNLNFTFSNK